MEHRWVREPLEETLDGARLLTVSVVDELVRDGWEQLALVAGIPRRRWRRHHPVGDGPLVALVEGEPAFDAAAWARFASLVPGAVALRSRTAAMLGLAPGELRPPARAPLRVADLLRSRRMRARLRRAERSLAADLAGMHWMLRQQLEPVLAPGDDGTAFVELPAYALAARLELAMAAGRDWRVPVTIDLASGDATARLLRLLVDRGASPGDALLQLAQLTTSGTLTRPEHLEELDELARLAPAERDAALEEWLDGLGGWHAMRDLVLEAPPLRDDPAAVRALLDHAGDPAAIDVGEPDPHLRDAVARARRLVALRERAAHARADLHAALRAVAHVLARRLAEDGALPSASATFDLHWRDLVKVARGVPTSVAPIIPPAMREGSSAAAFQPQLRGIPASGGSASGPVLVLDDPRLDAPVDGAVLVCRVTDPAWLPLMLRCSALVTERGGPLSHAAIVARELGLPAVVGTRGACSAARAAASAHVDGTAGIVRFER